MLKRRLKEYFTFTRKERNGIIVLLGLIFLVTILNIYINHRSFGEIVLVSEEFSKDIEEFEKSLQLKEKSELERNDNKSFHIQENSEWSFPKNAFEFDPNTVSESQLISLGFSNKQIKTLINFREKGGLFYEKQDLLKIYGIENEQYSFLKQYILIPENSSNKDKDILLPKKAEELVEINSASQDELLRLYGIGNTYALRIIKYRDRLGGFYSAEQLLEVNGMDSIRFMGFKNRMFIDTNKILKIEINSADYKMLIKHPYLNKYQTEAILKFVEFTGGCKTLEDIPKNNLLNELEFLRIKPYLKVEQKEKIDFK